MHKRYIFLFIFALMVNSIFAQTADLTIQGSSPDLYIVHTVAPKENWYSVGRLYNISPKAIAPFNSASLDKPLSIGQQLKVPLTSTNFSQDGSKAAEEVLVPVTHVVQDKEWMFRISTNYNKVPVENLEKWNHISKDGAKAGTRLIVGYLKVSKDQSALASRGVPAAIGTGTTAVPSAPPLSSPPPVMPERKVDAEPVQKIESKPEKQAPPTEEKTTVVSKPERQTPPAVEEKTTVVNKPVSQPAGTNAGSGGYFKTLYEENGKSASGAAGVFKSTSGWQDGKYYALINNVSIGTIVKVSNPVNNKAVFAKVLGQLPEMKESNGLTARLSDAAASELGVTTPKFTVDVKY